MAYQPKTLRRLQRIAFVHLGKAEVLQDGNYYRVLIDGKEVPKYSQVGKNSAARLRKLIREGK